MQQSRKMQHKKDEAESGPATGHRTRPCDLFRTASCLSLSLTGVSAGRTSELAPEAFELPIPRSSCPCARVSVTLTFPQCGSRQRSFSNQENNRESPVGSYWCRRDCVGVLLLRDARRGRGREGEPWTGPGDVRVPDSSAPQPPGVFGRPNRSCVTVCPEAAVGRRLKGRRPNCFCPFCFWKADCQTAASYARSSIRRHSSA